MHSRDNPSKDYVELLEEYKDLHKDPKYFNGICLITHLNTVSNIILKEGAKSVLDYGCGKALLYDDEKGRPKDGVVRDRCLCPNGQVWPRGDDINGWPLHGYRDPYDLKARRRGGATMKILFPSTLL